MNHGRYVLRTIAQLITSRLLYRICIGIALIIGTNYLYNNHALADTFEVASSITSIIFVASEIGMSMVLMRSAATMTKQRLEQYYGTALVIETIAWIGLLGIVAGGYAFISGFTPMFWLLLLLGIGQAIIQYRVVFRSIYRSLKHRELITFIEVLDGITKIIGMWLIVHYITDRAIGAYWIAGMFTVTTLIFIGIYGAYSFKLVRPRFNHKFIQGMAQEGVWFSAQTLIMTVYFEIDKLMLRLFQITGWSHIPAGDIAKYGAASRIIVFFLVFHRIGLQVITPYLYASFNTDMPRYRSIVQWSTRYMSAFGIALGSAIMILAEPILHLLYHNPELWTAAPALQLFGLFLIVRFIGITSSQIFATTGQQPLRTKQEFIGVMLNIALDIIFIPHYGFLGGAIATLITEIIIQTVFYITSRRLISANVWQTFKDILPALMAGIGMGLVVYLLQLVVPLVVSCLMGALTYIMLLIGFKFFDNKDLELIKS